MTKQSTTPGSDEAEFSENKFDQNWVGKIAYVIFRYRKPWLILFLLITIVLAGMASQLRVQAAFNKMIPLKHPYMQTFLDYAQIGRAHV